MSDFGTKTKNAGCAGMNTVDCKTTGGASVNAAESKTSGSAGVNTAESKVACCAKNAADGKTAGGAGMNAADGEIADVNRIATAFSNGKAFIAFITCGDPDLATTAAAVRAAVANGADLIELGIPFSDPTAEGPVIQSANVRALAGGVTTDSVFGLVRELRRDVTIPMVFMTYANVVFSYGPERFLATCEEVGIDGLILPDVPFEEKEEFLPYCRRHGVAMISLIAPTSEGRIAMIAKEAEGFLYIVSSLGVTGTRSEIRTDLASIVAAVRQNTDIPCAIGFGISTPEQASAMASVSDGAIVGSAIVKILAQYGKDAPEHVGAYVKSMKDAIRELG